MSAAERPVRHCTHPRVKHAHGTSNAYAQAKAPWFSQIWPRMQSFAQRTGWQD